MKNEPEFAFKYNDFIFVNENEIVIENRKNKLHKTEIKNNPFLKWIVFYWNNII